MDLPGFEPGAFRMQSERDTTTLQTRIDSLYLEHYFKPSILIIDPFNISLLI